MVGDCVQALHFYFYHLALWAQVRQETLQTDLGTAACRIGKVSSLGQYYFDNGKDWKYYNNVNNTNNQRSILTSRHWCLPMKNYTLTNYCNKKIFLNLYLQNLWNAVYDYPLYKNGANYTNIKEYKYRTYRAYMENIGGNCNRKINR